MFEFIRFELKYRFRRPPTYIYFVILFLLSFFAVSTDAVRVGGSMGQVNQNAPLVIARMMLILSAFGMLIVSAIMGVAGLRDFEHNTAPTLFTTPITKAQYLGGRFIGSFITVLFVFSGMVFGIMLGQLMPWVEAEKLAPFDPFVHLHPFITLIIPNLLFTAAIFFAGGALSRNLLVVYTQGAVLLVGYLISVNFISDLDSRMFAALADPFGITTMNLTTRYWTIAEQNQLFIPFAGKMLYNRLLWLSVGFLALAWSYYGFSFNIVRGPSRLFFKKKKGKPLPSSGLREGTRKAIPSVQQILNSKTRLLQILSLIKVHYRYVLRSIPFIAIILVGLAMLISNSFQLNSAYGTDTLPTTYSMLELINGFNLFFLIIIVFYSGEFIWMERDKRIDLIYDALPVPRSVSLLGKFLAFALIHAVLLLLLIGIGVLIQLFHGYYEFDLLLYFQSLFSETFLYLLLYTLLAFFLHVMVNNKFLGHAAMIVFFVVTAILGQVGVEHDMFHFASGDLGTYSAMNGFGHFLASFSWFKLYWTSFAILLFVLAILFSVRGAEANLRIRRKLAVQRLSRPLMTVGTLGILAFLLSGSYIFYNTNMLHTYRDSDEEEKLRADYEKTLEQYQYKPQPKISMVDLQVDLYPYERNLVAKGHYVLENRTDSTIRDVHIQHRREDELESSIEFEKGSGTKKGYEKFGYEIRRLDNPLEPGETTKMRFETRLRTRGFKESGSNTDLIYNGTFLNNRYFPTFGYNEGYELSRSSKRSEYDLEEEERMLSRDDPKGLNSSMIGEDADGIDLDITIGTAGDQIAIAPGYLQKKWKDDGRAYYRYKMDKPMVHFYNIVSADYSVKKEKWDCPRTGPIALEIYYHKGHEYNLDRMMKGMKDALGYYSREFSPYQYRQMRILEFPRYRRFAQSFANTVPFSEGMGFIMDIDSAEEDVDMAYYVTAHEMAHQWWGHQLTPADVRGSAMLTETLSQYSALMVMKDEYPREVMKKFLNHELDRYLSGRTSERRKEMPLVKVENQNYIHYRKGSLAMYALQDYISEDSVNKALSRFLDDWAHEKNPYPTTKDFMPYLEEVTPDSLQYLLEDMFRSIILYENRAKDATYRPLSDSGHKVTLDVKAKKYQADSLGNEEEVPMNEMVDVGVYGKDGDDPNEEPDLIHLEKERIDKKEMTIEVKVGEKPVKAGIDPLNKLIDRNPDDNRTSVEKEAGAG